MLNKEPTHTDLMTVTEVAEYLRLKERKIYYLLAQKQIPCVRVGKKWLFAQNDIDAWINRNNSRADLAEPVAVTNSPSLPPAVLTGSHDPLLEWAISEIDWPLAIQINGALEGLRRFDAGEAVICGTHLLDARGRYNLEAIETHVTRSGLVVIEWAKRRQGLIVARNNPLAIGNLNDIVRHAARLIQRQPGAGSQVLLQRLLTQASLIPEQIHRLPKPARNELELGLAILNGKADVGIGIEAAAKQLNLDFVPLTWERFDLVVTHADYFEPPFQALLRFGKQPEFARKADELTGYDITSLGTVQHAKR